MSEIEIKQLERGVSDLRQILDGLGDPDRWERLLVEWRRPGWTTPAEFTFVRGIVDSMISQASALRNLQEIVTSGSAQVSSG